MTLYHFTSERHINDVWREGLHKGVVLQRFVPPKFLKGYQWLTINPSWQQAWSNRSGLLPYSTTAYRITVEIPASEEKNLLRWSEVCHQMTSNRIINNLNACGDSESWMLFKGIVRPTWFTQIRLNPALKGLS